MFTIYIHLNYQLSWTFHILSSFHGKSEKDRESLHGVLLGASKNATLEVLKNAKYSDPKHGHSSEHVRLTSSNDWSLLLIRSVGGKIFGYFFYEEVKTLE